MLYYNHFFGIVKHFPCARAGSAHTGKAYNRYVLKSNDAHRRLESCTSFYGYQTVAPCAYSRYKKPLTCRLEICDPIDTIKSGNDFTAQRFFRVGIDINLIYFDARIR